MPTSNLTTAMIKEGIELDLFFRGGRDHIQAALVIRRLAEHLNLTGNTHLLRLTSCKFMIPIETGLRAFCTPQNGSIPSCTVQFKSGDNKVHDFWLYPVDTRPIRLEDTSSLLNLESFTISSKNPLSGGVEFSDCDDFETLLLNLFAFNKRLHLKSRPGVHTVLFTGIRGTGVPVTRDFSSGKFEIQNRINNGADKQMQSLSLVTIIPEDENLDRLKFQISFGYSIPKN